MPQWKYEYLNKVRGKSAVCIIQIHAFLDYILQYLSSYRQRTLRKKGLYCYDQIKLFGHNIYMSYNRKEIEKRKRGEGEAGSKSRSKEPFLDLSQQARVAEG